MKKAQATGRQPKARVQVVNANETWEWMVTLRRLDGSEELYRRGKTSDWPAAIKATGKCLKEIGIRLKEQ